MRVSLAVGLLSLVGCAAAAQTAPKPAVTTHETTAADLRRRLFLLADDSMGGREPGTIGNFKATDYIAAEFVGTAAIDHAPATRVAKLCAPGS